MKKLILFSLLAFSQFSNANWMTSFEDAKKMALATNKFMIVDFWATWCGPCKKMDWESWSDAEVNQILEGYIQVKVDIDEEKQLAGLYSVSSIPNMFIMDGNGKVVHSFMGYHDAAELKIELQKFAFSTEFLNSELVNYFKMKNYNTSLRVFQKYLDYSLLVNDKVKDKILDLGDMYLNDAKKELSKKDENYAEKKQRLDLLKLYELVYDMKFDKVSDKLSEFKESDISEGNMDSYYFLKYITAKAQNSSGLADIESKVKEREGFDFFITKTNFILSKRITQ